MLHGFGNNKHEWEATNDAADNGDKWHWNSHWFAEHGFYVLTYTARGFRDAACADGSCAVRVCPARGRSRRRSAWTATP